MKCSSECRFFYDCSENRKQKYAEECMDFKPTVCETAWPATFRTPHVICDVCKHNNKICLLDCPECREMIAEGKISGIKMKTSLKKEIFAKPEDVMFVLHEGTEEGNIDSCNVFEEKD